MAYFSMHTCESKCGATTKVGNTELHYCNSLFDTGWIPMTLLTLQYILYLPRSEVIPDTLDPSWRLLIDLPVDDLSSLEDLSVEVWDRDKASKDDFLVRCT